MDWLTEGRKEGNQMSPYRNKVATGEENNNVFILTSCGSQIKIFYGQHIK